MFDAQRILEASPRFLSLAALSASCPHQSTRWRNCERCRPGPLSGVASGHTRIVSLVQVVGDRDHSQESGGGQLLAVHEMRRSVEHVAVQGQSLRRIPVEMTGRAVRDLRELIAALDRRVPQVQRAGEAAIAREAAGLRARALKRIEELEREQRRTSRG